jgi:hypothetical protein
MRRLIISLIVAFEKEKPNNKKERPTKLEGSYTTILCLIIFKDFLVGSQTSFFLFSLGLKKLHDFAFHKHQPFLAVN